MITGLVIVALFVALLDLVLLAWIFKELFSGRQETEKKLMDLRMEIEKLRGQLGLDKQIYQSQISWLQSQANKPRVEETLEPGIWEQRTDPVTKAKSYVKQADISPDMLPEDMMKLAEAIANGAP